MVPRTVHVTIEFDSIRGDYNISNGVLIGNLLVHMSSVRKRTTGRCAHDGGILEHFDWLRSDPRALKG